MSNQNVSTVNHDIRKCVVERAQARAGFKARGETITAWSLTRGFNPAMVHAVLSGHMKCQRGQAHKIAVSLGLKPQPQTDRACMEGPGGQSTYGMGACLGCEHDLQDRALNES